MSFAEAVAAPSDVARFYIGTAGWSIPREHGERLPGSGSHLERYAAVLGCAEINSSFYRPHRTSTYARWAGSTPEGFRFSVKVPKAITHESRLAPAREQIRSFLDEVKPLGEKLGPLLFQLPPKQDFVEEQARAFLALFRELAPEARAVLEPRHRGWFTAEAEALLGEFRVSRVMADPSLAPWAESDGAGPRYFRLHGSPRVYFSSYSAEYLEGLAARIRAGHGADEVWCIFDNTTLGAALGNALTLASDLAGGAVGSESGGA